MAQRASISSDALVRFRAQHQVDDTANATNLLATATLAAPGAGNRNSVLKVDASYGDSTVTGLLQVKSGATVIAEKAIHGAGAIDFDGDFGRVADSQNEAMTAELAAGGAGVVGYVVIQGFYFREG